MAEDIESSKEDNYWEEFTQYCEENGISLDHQDDWEAWWLCWNAALDARKLNGDVSHFSTE